MCVSSSRFEYCSRCTGPKYKLWELLFGVKEEMTCYKHSAALHKAKGHFLKTRLVVTNKLQNLFVTKTDQK